MFVSRPETGNSWDIIRAKLPSSAAKWTKKSLRVLRVFCWILIDPPRATKSFLSPRRIPYFVNSRQQKLRKRKLWEDLVPPPSSLLHLLSYTQLISENIWWMRATLTNCNYNFCGSKPEAREVNFKIISHRKWLFLKYEALSRLSKWEMKYVGML